MAVCNYGSYFQLHNTLMSSITQYDGSAQESKKRTKFACGQQQDSNLVLISYSSSFAAFW